MDIKESWIEMEVRAQYYSRQYEVARIALVFSVALAVLSLTVCLARIATL